MKDVLHVANLTFSLLSVSTLLEKRNGSTRERCGFCLNIDQPFLSNCQTKIPDDQKEIADKILISVTNVRGIQD